MAHTIILPQQQPLQELPTDARAASRIYSIDFLRGLVMILMVLDHTRDFFHHDVWLYNPTDMQQSNPAVFFTRWVTHFCAPVFVFLAGTSIYLQALKGVSRDSLAYFLLTRGLWLIVLEFTLVRFGFMFDLNWENMGAMQVIWAIGVSMIVMAGLIYLPLFWIGAFGLVTIFTHNLLDGIQFQGWQGPGSVMPGIKEQLWFILHQPYELIFPFGGETPFIFVLYPLLPWVGVMAAGYVFGSLYVQSKNLRVKWLWALGLASLVLFVLLRLPNLYGDPQPWALQDSVGMSVASFLNVTKYPVSLQYLLLTLGFAFLLLARLDGMRMNRWLAQVVIFGRVPLFFYLLQWPLMHLLAILLHMALGRPVDHLIGLPFGMEATPEMGFSLWVVYLFWFIGICLLYPLCYWFAGVKRRNKQQWWLSYL